MKIMRKLKTTDIFAISKILKKINIKIDAEGKSQVQFGAELILTAFENLHLAEYEVNEFFGSLTGMTANEFSELEFEKTLEIIKEFKEISGIENFFKSAGQLTTNI
jgi:hypothetical protein